MSMFDWYQPVPGLSCPICGNELNEWQGKDGPKGLFIWKQGGISPVDQTASEDCKLALEDLRRWRLPGKFEIYSYDCSRHAPIIAQCQTANEVWTGTKLLDTQSK